MSRLSFPRFLRVGAAGAALVLAAAGAGATEFWSVPGSTGIVDETGASLARQNNPALNFKTDAVGTIVARYPIVNVFTNPAAPSPNWLAFGFTDSGPNTQIVLRLYEESANSGALRLLWTQDSNDYPASNGYQFVFQNAGCLPTLNFAGATYWIEATITRTVATAGVGLRSIRMDNAPCFAGAAFQPRTPASN